MQTSSIHMYLFFQQQWFSKEKIEIPPFFTMRRLERLTFDYDLKSIVKLQGVVQETMRTALGLQLYLPPAG